MPISVPKKAKKLVSVLATLMSITKNSKEAILVSAKDLKQAMYI